VKLNIQTDFTKFPRATSVVRAADAGSAQPFDTAALAHDERQLRRRVVELAGGDKVLADLLEAVTLEDGDRLVLEDGRQVGITAAAEEVYEVRGRDGVHLAELAWHLGERHLAVAVDKDRILVLRDPAAKAALEKLGAEVKEGSAAFRPLHSAHEGHGHHDHDDHHHGHGGHDHHHGHGEPDAFGRLPGDPHYGHNHA
jgi:urease accessory protein